ncbi:hypothetical protein J7M23_04855 [Candidatus Sumerlaeota bacterium]|nr:hypothetical protein [Candidatus Sumerlaeota bacterium]
MPERLIGHVTHYYNRIGVAAIELVDTLRVGEKIHILGKTTDFIQTVTSMEENHCPIQIAEAGHAVGIRVGERVRKNDKVYIVEEN